MDTKRNNPEISRQIYRTTVKAAILDFQAELRKIYGRSAPMVLIYGSYARREENADSDVDILLIYKNKIQPGKEIQRISSVLSDLNLRYQVLISVLPGTEYEYQSAKGMLWQNLRQESIPIEQF
ncbi:MAG: nucleotidyltransferase domain-containing protein [Anaerolineales bacterium]|nr:nucleotidyltransferase domain-containing protein [Anaerolineales bacterium]